jgi:hypothetical protein
MIIGAPFLTLNNGNLFVLSKQAQIY